MPLNESERDKLENLALKVYRKGDPEDIEEAARIVKILTEDRLLRHKDCCGTTSSR